MDDLLTHEDAGQLRHSRSGAVYVITDDGSWRRLPPEDEIEARERFRRKERAQRERTVETAMAIEKQRINARDVTMTVTTKKRDDGLIVNMVKLTHKPTGRSFEEWSESFDDAKEAAQRKLQEAFDLEAAEKEALG